MPSVSFFRWITPGSATPFTVHFGGGEAPDEMKKTKKKKLKPERKRNENGGDKVVDDGFTEIKQLSNTYPAKVGIFPSLKFIKMEFLVERRRWRAIV